MPGCNTPEMALKILEGAHPPVTDRLQYVLKGTFSNSRYPEIVKTNAVFCHVNNEGDGCCLSKTNVCAWWDPTKPCTLERKTIPKYNDLHPINSISDMETFSPGTMEMLNQHPEVLLRWYMTIRGDMAAMDEFKGGVSGAVHLIMPNSAGDAYCRFERTFLSEALSKLPQNNTFMEADQLRDIHGSLKLKFSPDTSLGYVQDLANYANMIKTQNLRDEGLILCTPAEGEYVYSPLPGEDTTPPVSQLQDISQGKWRNIYTMHECEPQFKELHDKLARIPPTAMEALYCHSSICRPSMSGNDGLVCLLMMNPDGPESFPLSRNLIEDLFYTRVGKASGLFYFCEGL
jgi:hypothetical protein